jgi:hypothetical protein
VIYVTALEAKKVYNVYSKDATARMQGDLEVALDISLLPRRAKSFIALENVCPV